MFNSLFKEGRFLYRLGLTLGFSYVRWVGTSTKWHLEGEEHFFLERAKGKPIIFVFWHQQLMMMPFFYRAIVRRLQASVLISRSRDGGLLSDLIKKFDLFPIRGSSSRGGTAAVLQLTRRIEQGIDLAMTPDGPRGPRCQVQEGAVALASLTGAPILPVAVEVEKKKELNTWDGFKIPFPYNRGTLIVGPAIYVQSNIEDEHLRLKMNEVQKALDEVNERAKKSVVSCKV